MSEPNQLPRAGWYPDPHVPDQSRFWDGTVWTEQVFKNASADTPVGLKFAMLGQGVRAGLLLSLFVGLGEVALYIWGLSMFDSAIANGERDRLTRFDDLNEVLTISGGGVVLVTGILWLIWQYQLASSITAKLDRSPGWHLGSWFIPIANFVMPFQNVRDLWRKLVSVDTAVITCWWLAVVGTGLSQRIASAYDSSEGLGGLKAEVGWWLTSSVIGTGAAVLAIVMVRKLTIAGLQNSASGGQAGLLEPTGPIREKHLPNLRQDRPGPGPSGGAPRPF